MDMVGAQSAQLIARDHLKTGNGRGILDSSSRATVFVGELTDKSAKIMSDKRLA
jgi:hypothetical protein